MRGAEVLFERGDLDFELPVHLLEELDPHVVIGDILGDRLAMRVREVFAECEDGLGGERLCLVHLGEALCGDQPRTRKQAGKNAPFRAPRSGRRRACSAPGPSWRADGRTTQRSGQGQRIVCVSGGSSINTR